MKEFLFALTALFFLTHSEARAQSPQAQFEVYCDQRGFGDMGICSQRHYLYNADFVIAIESIGAFSRMPGSYIMFSQGSEWPGSDRHQVKISAETKRRDGIATETRTLSGDVLYNHPHLNLRQVMPSDLLRSAQAYAARFGPGGSTANMGCDHPSTQRIYIFDRRQKMILDHMSCLGPSPYQPIEDIIVNLAAQIDPKTALNFRR